MTLLGVIQEKIVTVDLEDETIRKEKEKHF